MFKVDWQILAFSISNLFESLRSLWEIITISNNSYSVYKEQNWIRSNLNVCPLTIWCVIMIGCITHLPTNENNILDCELCIMTNPREVIRRKRKGWEQENKWNRMCLVDEVNIFCSSLTCSVFFPSNSSPSPHFPLPFLSLLFASLLFSWFSQISLTWSRYLLIVFLFLEWVICFLASNLHLFIFLWTFLLNTCDVPSPVLRGQDNTIQSHVPYNRTCALLGGHSRLTLLISSFGFHSNKSYCLSQFCLVNVCYCFNSPFKHQFLQEDFLKPLE